MPITTLDPRTALVVIDLQTGIAALPLAHPIDGIVAATRLLADAFRERALPVVLVTVDGTAPGRSDRNPPGGSRSMSGEYTRILPELGQTPTDHHVVKKTTGAFSSTDLDGILRREGVTQVVVTGVATGSGVESTVRHAYELGYNVTVAIDAMTDGAIATHEFVTTTVFPKMAETGTTAEILAHLP